MSALQIRPVYTPFLHDQQHPIISTGLSYSEACLFHVENTVKCHRVYLLLSKSLSNNWSIENQLRQALGDHIVGIRIGMKQHTLWSEVLEIVDDCRALDIDCIITVGAGTLTDAAKVIVWALANDIVDASGLQRLSDKDSHDYKTLRPPKVKHIAVPTSLSGGEFTPYAGATNDKTKAKVVFYPPIQNPSIVILDPAIASTTPNRLFLATGVRAIDHCVETACSLQSNKEGDEVAIRGLQLLIPALVRYKKNSKDLDAVQEAQFGAAESIKTSAYGVQKGASHAIGHQLGPLGVPHGETSCVMLPAVCRFNASKGANVERQEALLKELLKIPEIESLVPNEHADLADVLQALIRSLDLPTSLMEVGIGADKFDSLAENTLSDMWAKTNPVPLVRKADILEILEKAR
jgi:alcohol dehydrogenase class IV